MKVVKNNNSLQSKINQGYNIIDSIINCSEITVNHIITSVILPPQKRAQSISILITKKRTSTIKYK